MESCHNRGGDHEGIGPWRRRQFFKNRTHFFEAGGSLKMHEDHGQLRPDSQRKHDQKPNGCQDRAAHERSIHPACVASTAASFLLSRNASMPS